MGNCHPKKEYNIEKCCNNKVIYEGSIKDKKKHGYGMSYINEKKTMKVNGKII